MSIYTRTGDNGNTSTFGGNRMRKSDPLFSVLGSIDELNCWLGMLISSNNFTQEARTVLINFQSDLFVLGSYLGNPDTKCKKYLYFTEKLSEIEHLIDETDSSLPELNNFILPGGTQGASIAHICRTVCRRAERDLITYYENSDLKEKCPEFLEGMKFLNRMSDFFFVLARKLNSSANVSDIIWNSPSNF